MLHVSQYLIKGVETGKSSLYYSEVGNVICAPVFDKRGGDRGKWDTWKQVANAFNKPCLNRSNVIFIKLHIVRTIKGEGKSKAKVHLVSKDEQAEQVERAGQVW
eukprot:scaffold207398_cov15-Tisochrysis_lutea.AAC.1